MSPILFVHISSAVVGLAPTAANVMGGSLLFYLVTTGWIAGTRRERGIRAVDVAALLLALAIGAAGIRWGVEAAGSRSGALSGYPAGMFFVFGSIALLFAVADVRMLLRGGVMAMHRLARHLWRISLGLLAIRPQPPALAPSRP